MSFYSCDLGRDQVNLVIELDLDLVKMNLNPSNFVIVQTLKP